MVLIILTFVDTQEKNVRAKGAKIYVGMTLNTPIALIDIIQVLVKGINVMTDILKIKENLNKPPLSVFHTNLKRFSEDSAYKSYCPFCDCGILPMQRDQETYELLADDYCLSCGTKVTYVDLKRTGLS